MSSLASRRINPRPTQKGRADHCRNPSSILVISAPPLPPSISWNLPRRRSRPPTRQSLARSRYPNTKLQYYMRRHGTNTQKLDSSSSRTPADIRWSPASKIITQESRHASSQARRGIRASALSAVRSRSRRPPTPIAGDPPTCRLQESRPPAPRRSSSAPRRSRPRPRCPRLPPRARPCSGSSCSSAAAPSSPPGSAGSPRRSPRPSPAS